MTLCVATKSPTDIDGAAEVIGVFNDPVKARVACNRPGSYMIANVTLNRAYQSGELLDVSFHRVIDPRELR